ncbi:MAG: serine hydrolase [Erythrobacter sp.]
MLKYVIPALALILTPSMAFAQNANPQAIPPNDQGAPISILDQRAADVLKVVKGEMQPVDIFAPSFLGAVTPEQFNALTAQVTAQFGQPQAIENLKPFGPYKAAFDLRFVSGIGRVEMALSGAGENRITELLIRRIDPINDDVDAIKADLEALPGEVGVYFGPLDGTNPRLAINANRPLAIGSTAKIYILSALTRKIDAGEANWDDVVSITTRSFPSGVMQDWPDPAPVTLQTLATMMISISDNTATDSLLDYLGQDAVIAEMKASGHSRPEFNIPFLQTKQLFKMKGAGDKLIGAYRSGNVAEKTAILESIEDTDVTPAEIDAAFANGPYAIDVEWIASAHDLRKMLAHLPKGGAGVPLKVMAVNPSAPDTFFEKYPRIFYKGGSEPGVLNFTWLMMDKAGGWHVLTMGWNNPAAELEERRFELLAQRLFALPL